MPLTIYQVDAFTDRPFAGNPAAVAILAEPADEGWMQDVATEMNLSETAFLVLRADGAYDLRWFTPAAEVDLCGHATLGSAHVLWETGHLDASAEAVFYTKSGRLSARRHDGLIQMDFPRQPAHGVEDTHGLVDILGATDPVFFGRNHADFLVVLGTEAEVRALRPDMLRLKALGGRGVIVTAPAESDAVDFVSRFFAPAFGIPEDPVTGSAHCCLGPYWHGRLQKSRLVGHQVSARGGIVYVEPRGERILLGGQAVMVFTAELIPEPVAA